MVWWYGRDTPDGVVFRWAALVVWEWQGRWAVCGSRSEIEVDVLVGGGARLSERY
jgi:hypothetical protein